MLCGSGLTVTNFFPPVFYCANSNQTFLHPPRRLPFSRSSKTSVLLRAMTVSPSSLSFLDLAAASDHSLSLSEILSAVTANPQISVAENHKGLFLTCDTFRSVCVCVCVCVCVLGVQLYRVIRGPDLPIHRLHSPLRPLRAGDFVGQAWRWHTSLPPIFHCPGLKAHGCT